jgi:tetratricopeptide (TPR) repeat protein
LEAITLFKESVEYLKTVQVDFEKTEDSSRFNAVLGHITAHLGLHHYYVLQYEKANEYLEEAIRLLSNCRSRVERAQAQVMLAAVREFHGQLKESVALLEQSREVFREEGEDWWYALSTINLAYSNLDLGKNRECEALFQEGLRLVEPGDLRLELLARNGYAFVLYIQTDFAKAEQILQENLQLSYRLGNDHQTAFTLDILGRVALANHQTELAEEYLQKSINFYQEFGGSPDLALAYIHLGWCFAAKPDQNAARDQFRQVIRIAQELNKLYLVYYGLLNIAWTYMTEGQIAKALEIFLLLRHCPVEHKRIQEGLDHLQADLKVALPEGQIETAMKRFDSKISPDNAWAAVIAYVQEHKTG